MILSEQYKNIDKQKLLSEELILDIVKIPDEIEKSHVKIYFDDIAKSLKCYSDFNKLYKLYNRKNAVLMLSKNSNVTTFSDMPTLNCGKWVASDRGIYTTVFRGEVEVKEYAIMHPILIEKIYLSYENKLEFVSILFNSRGKIDNVVVPKSIIANRNKIVSLADYGIEVTSENARHLVSYLSDICCFNDIKVISASDKLGWKKDEFSPYDDNVYFLGESKYKELFHSICEKGDYESWFSYTKKLVSENIIVRLVFLASCVSPFIEKLGVLSFILHLWGGTESGKTVCLMLGASVWGDPELGKLVKSLNNTFVSVERIADTLNNFPIFCDELQLIKHQSLYKNGYDSLIMTLCQGVGKGRGNTNGGIDKLTTWRNLFIFTGEEPITSDNIGGGSKNRVIEIEANTKIIDNGMETSNFYRKNYGFFGKELITFYKENKGLFTYTYEKKMKSLFGITSDKQAMAFSLILMMDEIIARNFFDYKPLSLNDIRPFLKGKDEINTIFSSYEFILSTIAKNKIRFISNTDTNKGEIWGFIIDDYCYFDKMTLESILRNANFNFNAIKKGWLSNKFVSLNSQGKYSHQRRVHGVNVSFIKINVGKIEDLSKEIYENVSL